MFPWKNAHVPNNEGVKTEAGHHQMFLLVKLCYSFLQDFYHLVKIVVFSLLLTYQPSWIQMTSTGPFQSKSSNISTRWNWAEVQVPGFLHRRSLGIFQRGKALVSTNCRGRTSGEFTVEKRRNLPREYDILRKIVSSKWLVFPRNEEAVDFGDRFQFIHHFRWFL